jgi:hypothetical protein
MRYPFLSATTNASSSGKLTVSSHPSSLVKNALAGDLIFRPAPPGDRDLHGNGGLSLPQLKLQVDVSEDEMRSVKESLSAGTLSSQELKAAIDAIGVSDTLRNALSREIKTSSKQLDWNDSLEMVHRLDALAVVAVKIIDRAQKLLLKVEPLTEVHFVFSDGAKGALAVAWEAMVKRGAFPLPPSGSVRIQDLRKNPCGAMHFVSASDLDAGYFYTMGISQSPEAQALGTMDLSYGLDGELIVPGQAVSPIPPFLAMATRLFAASIPTSSNISEEVHSIPMRNFPHPTAIDDLKPLRGGVLCPPVLPRNLDEAITDLKLQLNRYEKEQERKRLDQKSVAEISHSIDEPIPQIGAVFEVTGMNAGQISHWMRSILNDQELEEKKKLIALYLNIEPIQTNRVAVINLVVDVAAELGLKYVAVADDVEDSLLPDLLEYLTPDELNDVADHADNAGVLVVDGRPIDPVYTAATAAQRIQSVFTTLSVDILKMGMWLCLDALNARRVWRQILRNPHIPTNMFLMPIGIVEPWNAFVDNRNPGRTARAIIDPFEKIKFMIEEAMLLKIPSLLTDTRHKEKWVLLGQKTKEDEPHLRERFIIDPVTGANLGRTKDSAIPLLSWKDFMECERLARQGGILLGQAGSIEADQAFKIISETTYSAAKEGRNPASAIWTAETERVLRTKGADIAEDLQSERSSAVSPFLAVINRGMETHAKLEGWLRYLEEAGEKEMKLRQELNDKRKETARLLETCVQSQRAWRIAFNKKELNRYQEDWNAYRQEYIAYHTLMKDNFLRIRDRVASKWKSMINN